MAPNAGASRCARVANFTRNVGSTVTTPCKSSVQADASLTITPVLALLPEAVALRRRAARWMHLDAMHKEPLSTASHGDATASRASFVEAATA